MKSLLKEYIKAADEEVARWNGARIADRTTGKHCRVTLEFDDQTRFVIHPASPSDIRGVHRHVQDIKRTLMLLGAERDQPKKIENNA